MENNLFFEANYNRIIISPLEVKAAINGGIVTPNGMDASSMLSKYDKHPKQGRIIAIGTLDERYEGKFKVGDQVLLRLGTMVEPVVIKKEFYGSIAPSDIIGKTRFHEDLKLKIDKDFHNKTR